MKKIISLVLALALVMSLAIGAAAATGTDSNKGGTSTIKVTLPIQGVNTYKVYKIFDATQSGTGDSAIISYTVKSGKTGVPNVEAQYTTDYDAATIDHFVTDEAGNVHYGTETTTTDGKTVITDSEVVTLPDVAIKAIAAYVTEEDVVATVTTTADDMDFTVTGLEYGYYYITTTTGSVVVVNSANPNAEVADKNTAPTLTKQVSATSASGYADSITANIGDTVYFEVVITAGHGAQNYVLHDVIDDGFTSMGTPAVAVSTDNGVSYTDLTTGYNVYSSNLTDTCDLEISFTRALNKDDKIRIRYSAVVGTDAVLGGDGNKNTATISYGATSHLVSTAASATVYTYSFDLVKTDADNKVITGAKFKLFEQGDGTASSQVYVVKNDDGTYTVTSTENPNVIEAGKVTIKGLGNGNYYLEETEAPAGYNKLTENVSFRVNDANNDATMSEDNTTWKENGVHIVNQAGSTLPSTGGMGTTIFYILGGLMTVGALVLLVTKKRMTAE